MRFLCYIPSVFFSERDGAMELPERCELCPRRCGVNRKGGETGFCGAGILPKVCRAALHYWEEPFLSGEAGSGTVFFSGCTLRCIFCQNREISRGKAGAEISVGRLAEIFLELQEKGANNINLVTPMHDAPQITEALDLARRDGLALPIVWNTGGWELAESVAAVRAYADIWLTDFKYFDDEMARNFSAADRYFEVASAALDQMVRQTGEPAFDENGMMKRGVVVRHLMLPGHYNDTKRVLEYLSETYGNRIWVSLMNQYTPFYDGDRYPELLETVSDDEYARAVACAEKMGIENCLIQEGGAVGESFVPPFDLEGVFKK